MAPCAFRLFKIITGSPLLVRLYLRSRGNDIQFSFSLQYFTALFFTHCAVVQSRHYYKQYIRHQCSFNFLVLNSPHYELATICNDTTTNMCLFTYLFSHYEPFTGLSSPPGSVLNYACSFIDSSVYGAAFFAI